MICVACPIEKKKRKRELGSGKPVHIKYLIVTNISVLNNRK